MDSKITPLGDRVVVEKAELAEKTYAGIVLPQSTGGNEQMIGKVIAVGEGRETESGAVIKPKVAAGQQILFSWGDKVEVDGKEYYIVSESSILGILN